MGIKIAFWAIIAVIVGGLAFFLSDELIGKPEPHVHDDTHAHGELRAIAQGQVAPTVSVQAFADTIDGYNLQISVENFAFSPENTGTETDTVEGHAHLYVNGVKIGRVYGEWVHLPSKYLRSGVNEIRVTLNDNMHNDWGVDGVAIDAVVEVSIP